MRSTPQILLIDDDRVWLETLTEFLRRKGFAVQAINDPVQGLARLENNGVVLAVIDFQMPAMNGLELLRQFRQRHPDLTVFMMSSDEESTLANRALAEGARAFVAKTAAPHLLPLLLQQALKALRERTPESTPRQLPPRRQPNARRIGARLALTFHPSARPRALLPRPR